MSKIIKKQFKRSIPWLVMLCLLSAMSVGALFNFEFNLKNWRNINIEMPEAMANIDMATTTVTVRNAPPIFSGLPYESPSSTSTTPVNASTSLSFKGTADDPEGNSYYLIVCSSNSVIENPTGGAPSCAATAFCTSALTSDNTEATCVYNNVSSSHPEIVEWYAFSCDNHGSDAACSNVSQGTPGNNDASPFYVNHAPEITAVDTSDDNKDPGGTFTITASSTDADITRGEDDLFLHICTTNSWATSTGCTATTVCTSTAATADPSCSFTDVAPTPDGDYTYYAFVMDEFSLGAIGNPATSTYTINNVAPVVGSVTLNNGAPITLNLKNSATSTVVIASSTVTDQNECADLVNATTTIYYSAATNADNCTANNNDCYKSTSCVITGCVAGSSFANITCSSTIAFHAVPTDAGYANNPYRNNNWLAAIRAFDEALNGVEIDAVGVEINSGAGLEISETAIPYGILRAGTDSGSYNATTTVINYGNTPLNTETLVSDMASGTEPIKIGADNQQWDLDNFVYGAGTPSSSSTAQNIDIVVPRPTDENNVSDQIFWGIGIPGITPSGDYVGTSTFTAVVHDNAVEW